ncbi:unnamed protein product [Linum tenue]|uniref:Uncharacterized protein n=1 Tax=Linum tenue TaxID=586396 RepID=A0AAV0I731_9ROSI|nr:unnamed protein product [Linum tenue]
MMPWSTILIQNEIENKSFREGFSLSRERDFPCSSIGFGAGTKG